jgi:hypothetical protein
MPACNPIRKDSISADQLAQQPPGDPHEPGDPQQPPPKSGIGDGPEEDVVLCADISFVKFVPLHERQTTSSSAEKTMNSLIVPQSSHLYS